MDANTITEVIIPGLTSVDTTLTYVKIENKSIYSLTFTRGGYELSPLDAASTIVMQHETAVYAMEAGGASGCAFMRNAIDPIAFPQTISEFKSGAVYTFRYDGSALVLTSAKDVFGDPVSYTVTFDADGGKLHDADADGGKRRGGRRFTYAFRAGQERLSF